MAFEENGLYYLKGIVSQGPSIINETTQETVCPPIQYTTFTDVAEYLPWIEEVARIKCEMNVSCSSSFE